MTVREMDDVLALQVAVAWAGEALSEPARLGWWRTDVVEAEGGGYLLSRLLPMTHRWASLSVVREAAVRVDRRRRVGMADPDRVRTLFFWGFEEDERLVDRLETLQVEGESPGDRLALPFVLEGYTQEGVVAALRRLGGGEVAYKVTPAGRQVVGPMPEGGAVAAARRLAGALVPVAEAYPMPFYRMER